MTLQTYHEIVTNRANSSPPARHHFKKDGSARTVVDLNALEGECLKRGITIPKAIARFLALNPDELEPMAAVALSREQANSAVRLMDKYIPGLKPVDSEAAIKDKNIELTWKDVALPLEKPESSEP